MCDKVSGECRSGCRQGYAGDGCLIGTSTRPCLTVICNSNNEVIKTQIDFGAKRNMYQKKNFSTYPERIYVLRETTTVSA